MRAYEGYGPIFIVHVDAHLDWRDEIGGIREGLSSPLEAAEVPVLSPDPLIQIVQPSKVSVRVPVRKPAAAAEAPSNRKDKT